MLNKRRKSSRKISQIKDIQLLQILHPKNQSRPVSQKHEESHSDTGELLKAILYGGLDGSTTIIIVVLSGISSGTSASMILGITIPTLIGHAVGMGLGDYLSAKAEIQYIANEKQGIYYQIDNMLQEQKEEVITIYTTNDPLTNQPLYSKQDASRVVELFATNRDVFAKILLLYERGLVESDISLAKRSGVATFVSFFLFGLIPALPYIYYVGALNENSQPWFSVTVIGILQLFSLGMGKGLLLNMDVYRAGVETLLLGAFLSLVGYLIGFAFPVG